MLYTLEASLQQTLPTSFHHFNVFYAVVTFVLKLRRRVRIKKYQNLSPRIFSILNDKASDFDFFRLKGYFKDKLSSLKDYMHLNQHKETEWLLMPESNWKLMWDSIILFCTIVNLIYIPFKLAFPL